MVQIPLSLLYKKRKKKSIRPRKDNIKLTQQSTFVNNIFKWSIFSFCYPLKINSYFKLNKFLIIIIKIEKLQTTIFITIEPSLSRLVLFVTLVSGQVMSSEKSFSQG